MTVYRKACSLDTQDWSVWNNLAWLLATRQEPSSRQVVEAVAAARHAVRLAPNRSSSHDTLGVALAAKGDFGEAVKAAQQAIQLAKRSDTHRVRNRLNLYRQGKRYIEP